MNMEEYLAKRGLKITSEMKEEAHQATQDKIEAYEAAQSQDSITHPKASAVSNHPIHMQKQSA